MCKVFLFSLQICNGSLNTGWNLLYILLLQDSLFLWKCADGTVFWKLLVPKSLSKVYIRHSWIHTITLYLTLGWDLLTQLSIIYKHYPFLYLMCQIRSFPRWKQILLLGGGLTVAVMTLLHFMKPVFKELLLVIERHSYLIWKP